MKVHKEIIQGTRDWHELRYRKIGGTRSKGLFVKSDTLLHEMIGEITEEFQLEESYISDDMLRGMDLEPLAIEELSKEKFIQFNSVGWISSVSIPLIGLSPDGISDCETIMCEVKSPGAKKHIATVLADEIPADNIHQCLHYFAVNPKLETLYFVSFRPESIKPLFVKELKRDSIVSLGTKAKPITKTVAEWTEIAQLEAVKLQEQINESIIKIKAL